MDPTTLEPATPGLTTNDGRRPAQWSYARFAVSTMFFVSGVVLSNWAPRIPTVQHHLGISNGELGLALLGTSVGALLAMPVAGWLATRYGTRPVITICVFALCLALPLPALATNAVTLGLALFVLGASNGALDVTMNAQAVIVQERAGRPILSSFHGIWSIGALTGALTGGLAAGVGLAPLPHFLIAGGICAVVALVAVHGLLPRRVDAARQQPVGERHRGFVRPDRRLLALGIIGFSCLLAEGAVSDWSAVYLKRDLGTSAGFAAAGFAAFSLTMAIFRLVGDRLTLAWGPVAMLRRGGLLVAGAIGVALLLDQAGITVLGFAGVGIGLATMVPVVFSAASQTPNQATSAAIAAVSTIGYLGFLAGPPLIGLSSEYITLRGSLAVIVLMGAVTALLAGNARPPR